MSLFNRKTSSQVRTGKLYNVGVSLAFTLLIYRASKKIMNLLASPAIYAWIAALLLGIFCVENPDIIMPFVLAFVLAYIGNPLVLKLMRFNLSRKMAVAIVFGFIFVGLSVLMLVTVPMLQDQVTNLISQLPAIINLSVAKINMMLHYVGLHDINVNVDSMKKVVSEKIMPPDQMASFVLKTTITSGKTFFSAMIDLVIIPFVTYYLLLDWINITSRFKLFIAKHFSLQTQSIIEQSDACLSKFFRGQLMVVLIMAVFYMLGMTLAGLKIGLVMGLIMGLLTIIPFMGSIIGLAFACVAAIAQSGDYVPLVWVLLVYAIGHILENFYVSPRYVGGKIGVHPVLVIFVILVGDRLAGALGVILALPLSSVAMIVLNNTSKA